MQMETANFAPGAAAQQTQPSNVVWRPTGAATYPLDETYASSLIVAYPSIIWNHDVIHNTGST